MKLKRFSKSVRPERSAEDTKSKGISYQYFLCFDFAELHSATLNTSGP